MLNVLKSGSENVGIASQVSRNPPLVVRPPALATPHIGFVERGNYERYFGDAFDAVNAFAAGKPVRVV